MKIFQKEIFTTKKEVPAPGTPYCLVKQLNQISLRFEMFSSPPAGVHRPTGLHVFGDRSLMSTLGAKLPEGAPWTLYHAGGAVVRGPQEEAHPGACELGRHHTELIPL